MGNILQEAAYTFNITTAGEKIFGMAEQALEFITSHEVTALMFVACLLPLGFRLITRAKHTARA